MRSLIPEIRVSEGAKVLPITLEYIRAALPASDIYDLLLGYYFAADKIEYLATVIGNDSQFTMPESLTIPIDFSQPVPFWVRDCDGFLRVYMVTAQIQSTDAQIINYMFSKSLNPVLLRDSRTILSEEAKTINISVVYPAEYMSPASSYSLVPSFSLAGEEDTVGETSLWLVQADGSEMLLVNGVTEMVYKPDVSLTLRVKRTIRGLPTESDYTNTIAASEDPNTIRSITDFRFTRASNPAIETTAVAAIYDTGDMGVITVSLLYTGSKPDSLVCSLFSPGTVADRDGNSITTGNPILSMCVLPVTERAGGCIQCI